MKERGGISVAGLFLLLGICGNSNPQSLQRISENGQIIYGAGEDFGNSGSRDLRNSIADHSQLAGLAATGGGDGPHTWWERSAAPDFGSAGGQSDISKHMTIDVSSVDQPAADQARPASTAAETVLGFETSGEQVPSKSVPSGVQLPGRQNALGVGQQASKQQVAQGPDSRHPQRGPVNSPASQFGQEDISIEVDESSGGVRGSGRTSAPTLRHGPDSRHPQRGPVTSPASQFGREDISIEVDESSGGVHGSGRTSTPGQRMSQTRPGQSRDSAAVSESAALSRQQTPAVPHRQLGQSVVANQGARLGGADPRDSIRVSAEFDAGQPTGGGPSRAGQAATASAPAGSGSGQQQWLPESIPGQSGVDYPVLSSLPQSGFDCHSQDADGFYADTSDESRCQAFWVCHNDQKDGFLCPNGTMFNQRYFACDWWFNVHCQDSSQYYQLNKNIGVLGTRIGSRPTSTPSPSAAGFHPVLTLLHDILQYPRVPPILPHSSPESAGGNQPVHSAAQPALPSRNQYSDDEFHALDRSSVHVSGGVPGIPPTEKHDAGQPSKMAPHEAMNTFIKVSEEQQRIKRGHIKRHTKRMPKKHSKRSLKRHRGSGHLRQRKVREHNMVEEAEGVESASSELSVKIPQVEQSAISQLKKRTPEPSSGAAYTSVQEGAMPDGQPPVEPGRSGPLLETIDKVAFPMNVKGPDFPKVEEDLNVQETDGTRKSTSIKDVLPSLIDIPQPGAVKVMAASGSQQNADAKSGLQNPVGNQASIIDLSGHQNTGVPENYAGISLTEDMRLNENVNDKSSVAMSDGVPMSGNYGQGHGVSLTEDVKFDKKDSVPSSSPVGVPQTRPEAPSMSVLESVAGDNGQGPGVSVQDNVQIDQKRDAPPTGPNQASRAMPQSSNPSVGDSVAGGNNNGPGLSMTENVQIDRKSNGHPDIANQAAQAMPQNPRSPVSGPAAGGIGHGPGLSMTEDVKIDHKDSSPSTNHYQAPKAMPQNPSDSVGGPAAGGIGHGPGLSMTEDVKIDHKDSSPSINNNQAPKAMPQNPSDSVANPMTGGNGQGSGLSLTENVEIGRKDNSPSDIPNQASQAMAGGQNSIGGQVMPGGGGGMRSAGGPGPENGGNPEGQMNVQGFLMDQRGGGAPLPTPPPSSAIRSEESVQVNFDETSQDQHQGGMPPSLPQMQSNQPQSPPLQTPPEGVSNGGSSDHQPAMNSNPDQDSSLDQPNDNAGGSATRISPKSEQVLEEQSNVKILIPYDGQEGGGFDASGPTSFNSPIGSFGLPNQVNSGLSIGNAGAQSIAQGQPQDHTADLLRGNPPSVPGPVGVSSRSAPQPASGKNDVRISEDVSVHRDPSTGAGPLSGSAAVGQSRPGYLHAGDARMNASAITIPKKEGSSKILEQLDARSQFASNVGDEPGTVKTHVQMQEEKLGDKPGTSDLFDDPSALKREMPSENVKASQQQQTPPPEPQGEVIPGRKNVQITSESVSRVIKNPSRHRSAISDPSGLDLPELLRPPGFGTKYSAFKAYPTARTVKPVSPATPQPSVARLSGNIDMKSNSNAAGSPKTQTLTAGISERQSIPNNAGVSGLSRPSAPQRTQRGDLSTKMSETLKMVDNILGPPPFKPKRNLQPKLQRAAYLDTMESGHPSSLKGRGRKRASVSDLKDGNMGINLTVLISDPSDGKASSHTGASVGAVAGAASGPSTSRLSVKQGTPPPSESPGRPAVQEQEKIRILNSLKDIVRNKSKGQRHKERKVKQTAKETEIKDVIEVKTSSDDDDSDKTYDYDISQLPAWMKEAVKKHVKTPHTNR